MEDDNNNGSRACPPTPPPPPPQTSNSHPLDRVIHLVAGGLGGTAGAILTCPLEVVKTRLQSSSGFGRPQQISSNGGGGIGVGSNGNGASNGGVGRLTDLAAEKRVSASLSLSTSKHPSSPFYDALVRSTSHKLRQFNLFDLAVRSSHNNLHNLQVRFSSSSVQVPNNRGLPPNTTNVVQCLRYIVDTEGPKGLFRGLGPNLVGVAPSRAIYFFTYSSVKKNVNAAVPARNRDTPFVHVVSAASAGFSAATCTNPIWLIKTRLQLDKASGNKSLTVKRAMQRIYQELGMLGFWRGVTASYWGVSETVIHFVIYEFLKKQVVEYQRLRRTDEKTFVDFFGFMLSGACSKTVATIVAYPHEVARTRLREEGTKYRSFWQTLAVVAREEGRAGLYRGLVTQLIRQIPNTAIMMATYELTVYLMTKALSERTGGGSNGQQQQQQMQQVNATSSSSSSVPVEEAMSSRKSSHGQ